METEEKRHAPGRWPSGAPQPRCPEARKRITAGETGGLILVHIHRMSRRPQRIGDVGAIKDPAIHDADIIIHIYTDDPEIV